MSLVLARYVTYWVHRAYTYLWPTAITENVTDPEKNYFY